VVGKKPRVELTAEEKAELPVVTDKKGRPLLGAGTEEYDEQIFDDTDFYSQLLREVIETGQGSSSSYLLHSSPRHHYYWLMFVIM
jgi:hypothetical protein